MIYMGLGLHTYYVLYSSIYIAPLNSHGPTEALLVRLAPRKETSFKKCIILPTVYACRPVHMHRHTHTHTRAQTYTHQHNIQTHIRTPAHTPTHTPTHAPTQTYPHTQRHTHKYIHAHGCI